MGKSKPFALFFNTGGVDERSNAFVIQPSEAEAIENLHMVAQGSWAASKQGYDNLTVAMEAGARIDSLGVYTNAAGTDFLVCAVNGKLKSLDPVTGTITDFTGAALTAGNPVDFETFRGTLFITEPGVAPQKWAGTGTTSAAGGWPITNGADSYNRPKMVEQYANRMAFANFLNFPSHVALSNSLTAETFTLTTTNDTDGIVAQIAPGDGQTITAMRGYFVPAVQEQVLCVFKERSVYILSGTTPNTFKLTVLNKTYGCLNNRCVVQVGQDLIFLDQNNIYSVTTANNSGTIQPKVLGSESIRQTLQTLNIAQKEKAWALHLPFRSEVWFGIPTGSSAEPDTILIYRYPSSPELPPVWSVRKNTTQTCGVLLNKSTFTGDNAGFVNKWFASSKYGGNGYTWRYVYPFYNFSTQFQSKRVIELFAWFLVMGPETITVKTEWRGGGSNIVKTITKDIPLPYGSAPVFGPVAPPAAVFGQSYFGSQAILKKVKLPVYGNGEMLRMSFSGISGSTAPVFLGCSGIVEYLDYSRSYK